MTNSSEIKSPGPIDAVQDEQQAKRRLDDEVEQKPPKQAHVDPVVKTYGISKIKFPQNSVIVAPRKPNLKYIPLKTGLCYDVRMRYHAKIFTLYYEYVDPHPEDPRRTYRIYKILAEEGLICDPTLAGSDDYIGELMVKIPVREASEEEILEVHSKQHLNFLKKTTLMTKQELLGITESEDSVYFNHDSYFCAKLSCGGVIEACKAVVEGKVKNSFAIVRPPGHHAEPETPGGFCLFSNVAVAAKNVLKTYPESVRKIVIIDWDIHHGNGTQKSFYDDPRVLYISLHRYEGMKYYPGTKAGDYDQPGDGAGQGFNVNIPWPGPGMGDGDYMYAFETVIMPICVEFDPDLVIVSSGFDAADGDMIGQCHVSPGCYSHMLHMLKTLARGAICVALEGGYNLDSISISALAVAKALLGEPPDELKTKLPSAEAVETIYKVKKFQSRFWKLMKPGFAGVSDNNIVEFEKTAELNSTCLADAVRLHQASRLKEKYSMINLPLLLSEENSSKYASLANDSPSFDNQILATPNIFAQETLCILVHDPFEIYGHVDPVYGNLESYGSVYVDPTERLVEWIVNTKGYGLVDILIPSVITGKNHGHVTEVPEGDEAKKKVDEYNNVIHLQELLLYVWDNYLKFFSNFKNVVFFGIGDSYNAIVYLLGHRLVIDTTAEDSGVEHAKIENGCVISFLDSHHQLRPIIPHLDENLTDWYFKNSLVFCSAKHPIWDNNNNYNKRPRKKFGRVLKSQQAEALYDVFDENYDEAIDFVLDTLEEYSSSEES